MQVHVKRANQTAKDVVKGVRPIKLIFAFLLSEKKQKPVFENLLAWPNCIFQLGPRS